MQNKKVIKRNKNLNRINCFSSNAKIAFIKPK